MSEERQLIHNFFTKEVTEGEFLDIERQSLTADDYGTEVRRRLAMCRLFFIAQNCILVCYHVLDTNKTLFLTVETNV